MNNTETPTYNLIYNLCTTFVNPILYYNISNIKRFIPKFNGKKIINVTHQNNYDFALQFVKDNFSEFPDIQFIISEDLPPFHETGGFINNLIPSVQSLNDNEFTFFAHTKGVTKYRQPSEALHMLWAYTMYEENLKDFNKISTILKDYSCCGCLRINKPYTALSFVNWHFSGAFFWFNNKKLFSKNWQNIYSTRYGLEAYLATHFSLDESFCLAYNSTDGKEDMLSEDNWKSFYKG